METKVSSPAPMVLTSRLFLKALGVIYLIAFLSLWVQIDGLIGSHGILPVGEYLQAVKDHFGPERYRLLPTLCCFDSSDQFLHFLCGGGTLLALLVIVDIAPALMLSLLWLFYLSLATVAQDFLGFQWDNLLLEAGFLAIFLAPMEIRPRASASAPPSQTIVWLLRWLLFRLLFSSGLVKLLSGDPTWRNLTALTVHYETQPLPTWIGWTIHQLPVWFHQMSTAIMFIAELGVPFLFFAPRRWRFLGCAATIVFQILILLTGNYCFFNLLTIALALLLLDDTVWGRMRPTLSAATLSVEPRQGRPWPVWIVTPLAALILFISSIQMIGLSRIPLPLIRPTVEVIDFLAPFRTVNSYGLFAVMTTSRPEIVIEGSSDGIAWHAYEFKYKPGDLKKRPAFVAPHQPRLDWQMWFAALGSYRENPWFITFCLRLLKGSPEVLALLKKNPFPEEPPRYLRAILYDYRFTDYPTQRVTGAWWRRERKGLYCPVLELKR